MIPKKIHYCWFGGAPKSRLIKKCIRSWNKYCSDYEIIEWNETNYDLNTAPTFVQQAYQHKKWAFVSDYVRLKVVYENGGIYLDTDVELIKNLDPFLQNKAFFGFDDNQKIATGLIIGAEINCVLLAELMGIYHNSLFVNRDGTLNFLDNTHRDSCVFEELGVKLDNHFQIVNGYAFYPKEFFCPMDRRYRFLNLTENTVSIHYFAASWSDTKYIHRKKEKIGRRYQYYKSDLKLLKAEKGTLYSVLYGIKNSVKILK